MRRAVALLVVSLAGAGCARASRSSLPPAIPPVAGNVQTAFSLRFIEVQPGTGAPMAARRCVFAHYTGWLRDGTKFDSSRDTMPDGKARTPIRFVQGSRQVIAGWDAGFEGMRIGGRRRLFIPYQLAYGEGGRPPVIPPKAELIFDVELMAVTDTLPRSAPPAPGQSPGPPACPSWEEARAAMNRP